MNAGLLIPLAGILMPLGIVAIVFWYENRKEQRFHDTVKELMASGQEINDEVLSVIPGYKKVMPRDDLRNGIITTGVGVGLTLFGMVFIGGPLLGAGLLVACIGASMLAYRYLNRGSAQTDIATTE